jgi:outer membrane autotransporter protein
VTVVNGSGGNILTQGVAAFGIAAQSVGGGGGEGSIAGVVSGSLKSLSIGVGGNGGGAGDGGAVSVTTGDGTAGSSITTTGKNGIGIFAQSVGGGGGLVRTMTTDQTFDPAQLINNPQGRVADVQGFSLTFGGQNGASGKGGPVQVTTNGPITTSGLDAHGILAQSIGGGGGAVVGGQLILPLLGNGGAGGGAGGDGGLVTIQLNGPTNIATTGNGAYGVLAQSIGGGGGLSGDPSGILVYNIATNLAVKANSGNGGAVSITANGATVHTSGQNAPAIFAQSIGGGGGLVNYSLAGGASQVQALGTAGGTGTGGGVTISLTGSSIAASGLGSSGIVAQSDGTSSSPIKISVDVHSQVLGGGSNGMNSPTADTAGIRLFGGTGNQITNAGYIGAASGVAILVTGPASNTTITNTGTIAGNIFIGGDPPVVNNQVGGVISATTIDLGSAGLLQNSGTLHVGGSGTTGTTILTGNLQQTPTGTLVVRLTPASNTADVLQVNGTATLDGRIVPVIGDASQLRSGARQVAIIAASGGLSLVGTANVPGSTPIVRYGLAASDANTLDLSYNVDFAATDALRAAGLASRNRAEVGRALNVALSGPAGDLALHGGRLATLTTPEQVAQSLDVLSGEGIADIQQTAFAAQQAYVTTVQRHVTTGIAESGPASYAVAALGPVPSAPANDNGVQVWLGGFGGNDMLSSTEGLGSLHSQIAGGLIGVDKWFDPDAVAGVSIGGGALDYSVPSRGVTGHSTTVNVAGYGLERFGRAYVSGILSYGNFATDAQRNALGGATNLVASAHASATSNVLGGRAELGWRQPLGGITLTPFAALEVDQLWQAPLTDTAVGGAGADALALHFSGVQQTSVPMTLGVRAGTSFAFGGDHVLSFSTELGWVHEFNPHRSVTAAFVAAPNVPFQSFGMSPSRDSALASVDARLPVTRNVALLGSFSGRFSGVETAVGGFGGLQVTW